MNDGRGILRVLNITSLIVFVIEVMYNIVYKKMAMPWAIFSSPGNVITTLIWFVTLYFWLNNTIKLALGKKWSHHSRAAALVPPLIYVIAICAGIVVNILIIWKYGLVTKKTLPIGYLYIILIDLAVIVVIGVTESIVSFRPREDSTFSTSGVLSINNEILFLGTAYALISSYALIVIIHAFSCASSDSFIGWICEGLFLTVLFAFTEVFGIVINIVVPLLKY